jgi:hypothetical protein
MKQMRLAGRTPVITGAAGGAELPVSYWKLLLALRGGE